MHFVDCQITHMTGMRVFSFLTDFRFFFCLLRPFFIIEQNAPKSSKWVYLFHNFSWGYHPARYFQFFSSQPTPMPDMTRAWWPKISPSVTTKIMCSETIFFIESYKFMTDSLIKLYNCKCDIYNSLFCYNFTSVSLVDWAIKSGPYAKSHVREKLIHNFFII